MVLSDEYKAILESIIVRSENDPNNPEFPPDDPRFPATRLIRINVPGFSDVSIKDESKNPTGTHKDRMAWEVVVTYKQILEAIDRSEREGPLPRMSIISTGNAALAIQTMLRKYKLPDLSVLVDDTTDQGIIDHLQGIGCSISKTDLSEDKLHSDDIKRLTGNLEGEDITAGRGFEAIGRYYDWFSYEVLNFSPDYVIMPYGTGDSFGNVLTISATEVSRKEHDPRFQGNVAVLRNCNFIGAKTTNPETRANHLYAHYSPFEHITSGRIGYYKSRGLCGKLSGVYMAGDNHLEEAIRIAESHGIETCPSGIFGLNYLLENRGTLPKDAKYVIVNTGCSQIDRILAT